MKKKVLSLLICGAMAFGSAVAFAEEAVVTSTEQKVVKVRVDERDIMFDDQSPIIENDRTLVPLRGVLEAMGSQVSWNGEERSITVKSQDRRTRVVMTIDNPEIRKIYYTTVTDSEITNITSEVAPKIMNDRTMIPLRVIAESLDADVDWNPETYEVTIFSKQYKKAVAELTADGTELADAIANNAVTAYLEVDKQEVKKGDVVNVTIALSNTEKISDYRISGVSAGVMYDVENFTYGGYKTYINGEETPVYIGADNGEFKNDSAKVVFLYPLDSDYKLTDGAFITMEFVAKNDIGGEFKLSDRRTSIGFDTYLTIEKDGTSSLLYTADVFNIDTTPVVVSVNGEAAEVVEELEAAQDEVNKGTEPVEAEETVSAEDIAE